MPYLAVSLCCSRQGIPVCGSSVQQSIKNSENTPISDESLYDATVEEGDEHRRQISGAPMTSMMCVHNPESSSEIV